MLLALLSLLIGIFSAAQPLFGVATCSSSNCPGSFYLPVVAAWANIGYMAHADFVYFVWNTSFGLWAGLFYVVGAVGALISVSINQPPRTYMWFFLGPPIYAFLVGTPTEVQGVAWRIANADMEMEDVWRDAETGMANSELAKSLGIQTDRKTGPTGTYYVAWPMVFLDGLFSEATNNMVSWIGMQRREGTGGAETNLFDKDSEQGPYHLLANLKWGFVENIVGVNVKDPDVRDALSTFLTSECGDWFKKGVNAGAYSAASMSRGANIVGTVFIEDEPSTSGVNDEPKKGTYRKFVHGMDVESIPTPRSVVRLFSAPDLTGSFRQFSSKLKADQALDSGRFNEIICSEYLYVIVQALRWEAGHAYWQLIRGFPNGITSEEMALKTLFYGWNLRENENAPLLKGPDLIKYTKFLILSYMLRNELIVAPQVTEVIHRFAPTEQMKSFTDAQVRQQGSRAKYGELYQWAVMLPHVQGVLVYLVLIGYPFAAMLMVIPGYWKAFFTWVSFFAWVKLWDVGFAIVHTLERSVWAMIGNNSSMASVGRRLIKTVNMGGGDIQVSCGGGGGGGASGASARLGELCSVPQVKDAGDLSQENAWFILDQILSVAGRLDLDLSNGYYIYIMSALYFAVPAVTGQLVLGAKASLGGLATQAIGQNAQEAGGAAKAGTVGENANRFSNTQGAIAQTGKMKSFRQSGFAQQSFDQQNAAMDADVRGAKFGGLSRGLEAAGSAAQMTADMQGMHMREIGALAESKWATRLGLGAAIAQGAMPEGAEYLLQRAAEGVLPENWSENISGIFHDNVSNPGAEQAANQGPAAQPTQLGSKSHSGRPAEATALSPNNAAASPKPGIAGRVMKVGGEFAKWAMAASNNSLNQSAGQKRALGAAAGLDLGWDKVAQDLFKSGHQTSGSRAAASAELEAESAAWDAKNQYASHASAAARVYGGDVSVSPGPKPADMMGFALSGQLGADSRASARYGASGYFSSVGNTIAQGKKSSGSSLYYNNWQPMTTMEVLGKSALGAPGRFTDYGSQLKGKGGDGDETVQRWAKELIEGVPEEVVNKIFEAAQIK